MCAVVDVAAVPAGTSNNTPGVPIPWIRNTAEIDISARVTNSVRRLATGPARLPISTASTSATRLVNETISK